MINGLSFECNGNGDYDTSSPSKVPRRIRVKPKAKKNRDDGPVGSQEKSLADIEDVESVTTKMKSRDPSKTKRVRLPSKSRSSMKVSFSSKISSDDEEEDDDVDSTSTISSSKISIPKVGGDRGIFAKWPRKVM